MHTSHILPLSDISNNVVSLRFPRFISLILLESSENSRPAAVGCPSLLFVIVHRLNVLLELGTSAYDELKRGQGAR